MARAAHPDRTPDALPGRPLDVSEGPGKAEAVRGVDGHAARVAAESVPRRIAMIVMIDKCRFDTGSDEVVESAQRAA
eukprot:6269794-Pyramimonas_sp.AAC.2